MFFKIIHSKGKFNVYSEIFFLTFILNQIFVCNIKGFFCARTVYYILKDIHVYIQCSQTPNVKKVHVVDDGNKSVFQTQ